MTIGKNIVIGDIVDLTSPNDGIPYRTKVEDIIGSNLYTVSLPSSGGQPMVIHPNDEINLTFYRETGKYTIRVVAQGFSRRDELRLVTLMQVSEPEKDQRRMYFRLPVSLRVVLFEYTSSFETIRMTREQIAEAKIIAMETVGTKDMSVTGVGVLAKNEYDPGRKFILDIYFDDKRKEQAKPFVICAEVMRADFEKRSRSHHLGMHFFGQTPGMSEYLARYLVKQQQIQVRQRRLVEG